MNAQRPSGDLAAQAGISGHDFAVQLEYLRHAAAGLEVTDPVPARLAQVARWGEPPDFAGSWLAAAAVLERDLSDVDEVRSAVDAGWEGAGAEAFLALLTGIGRCGAELADDVRGLAGALRDVASDLHRIGEGTRRLIAESAEAVHLALHDPAAGPDPARERLDELRRVAAERTGVVDRVLTSFAAGCDEIASVRSDRDDRAMPARTAAAPPEAAPAGAARSALSGPDTAEQVEPVDPAPAASAADSPGDAGESGQDGQGLDPAAGAAADDVLPAAGRVAGLGRKRARERPGPARRSSLPGRNSGDGGSGGESRTGEAFFAVPDAAPPVFGDRREKPE